MVATTAQVTASSARAEGRRVADRSSPDQGSPVRSAPNRSARRRCLASGRVLPKESLLRFVVGPGGDLVPDLAERLPGRGLWLLARRDMMAKACKKNLFAKAAKRQVNLPSDLAERVEQLALKRCLDQLGLARRAGAVVLGFEKVKAGLRADRLGLLLQASDGAADGRDKLRALARAVGGDTAMLQFCDAAQLGAALGREAAVHVGVVRGRFAAGLQRDIGRLAGLRGDEDQENEVGRPTEGER